MNADIRIAAHHEAKARYGVGRDPAIRRMGFEDGADGADYLPLKRFISH